MARLARPAPGNCLPARPRHRSIRTSASSSLPAPVAASTRGLTPPAAAWLMAPPALVPRPETRGGGLSQSSATCQARAREVVVGSGHTRNRASGQKGLPRALICIGIYGFATRSAAASTPRSALFVHLEIREGRKPPVRFRDYRFLATTGLSHPDESNHREY